MIQDEKERNAQIFAAVHQRLESAKEQIEERINYFSKKFNTFLSDFIVAQCNTYNYVWKEKDPVIFCNVG